MQTKTQILHEPVTVLSGVTIGNFAFWADSILVAVLLYYGANSFKRVTEVECDNQLPYIFQVDIQTLWKSPGVLLSILGIVKFLHAMLANNSTGAWRLLDLSVKASCRSGCMGM